MALITITSNAKQVAAGLEKTAAQMPFAMALALTRTAQAAQGDVRDQLGESFTLRNDWVSKGIRVKPARRTALAAEVWTKDRFLALHITGGDRVPFSAGKDAVPVGARAKPRDFTRKASYPGKLLAPGGRGYKVDLGGGAIGVFKRKGHGKRSKTVLFWVLKRSITIEQDWPFEDQINAAVARELPSQIEKGIVDALRTARPDRT